MKMAIVSELYRPSTGGQEVRYQEIATELVRRGHEVEIFTIGHDANLARSEVWDGVRVHRVLSGPRVSK